MSTINGNMSVSVNETLSSARNSYTTSQAIINRTWRSPLSSANTLFVKASAFSGVAVSFDFAGSLEDPIGDSCVMSKIYAIHFENQSDSAMSLGTGANQLSIFNSAVSIRPRCNFTYISDSASQSITVTGGSSDCIGINGASGKR